MVLWVWFLIVTLNFVAMLIHLNKENSDIILDCMCIIESIVDSILRVKLYCQGRISGHCLSLTTALTSANFPLPVPHTVLLSWRWTTNNKVITFSSVKWPWYWQHCCRTFLNSPPLVIYFRSRKSTLASIKSKWKYSITLKPQYVSPLSYWTGYQQLPRDFTYAKTDGMDKLNTNRKAALV